MRENGCDWWSCWSRSCWTGKAAI